MEDQEKSRLFKFLKIDSIIENLTGLIEARLDLAKLETLNFKLNEDYFDLPDLIK